MPRRRTVLAVPEFDWAIGGLRQWVEEARPLLVPGDHPALWLTERLHRISLQAPRQTVLRAARRGRSGPGTDVALSATHYVTHLIEFGYPERFVQEQVGHAYASTTAIYASVSNDFKHQTLRAALARVYDRDHEGGSNYDDAADW